MIKLSDVKVRPQYRTWVRHRRVVLEYAWGARVSGPLGGIIESVPGRFGGGGSAGGPQGSRGWCRRILGTDRGGCRPQPWS